VRLRHDGTERLGDGACAAEFVAKRSTLSIRRLAKASCNPAEAVCWLLLDATFERRKRRVRERRGKYMKRVSFAGGRAVAVSAPETAAAAYPMLTQTNIFFSQESRCA
jgi:hypothetical protein